MGATDNNKTTPTSSTVSVGVAREYALWRDTWTALCRRRCCCWSQQPQAEANRQRPRGAYESHDESDDDDASEAVPLLFDAATEALRGASDDMADEAGEEGEDEDRAAEAASKRRRLLLSPAADRAALARWLPKALRHRRLSLAFAASHDGYHPPTLLHRCQAASSDHSGRSNLPSVLVAAASLKGALAAAEGQRWRQRRQRHCGRVGGWVW